MNNGQLTYCNPLPLSNYQRGRVTYDKASPVWGWMHETRRDFREAADPTVIRFNDRWYLFPSCGMLWYSDDMVNWTFHPIEPFDAGYAPTVVQKGEYLYLTACSDTMWRAKDPLGEWECLGKIKDENGRDFSWNDPMLFVDDDGAMYGYHGLGPDGIYVARLRDDDPTRFAEPRVHCFAFNPDHIWERSGEYNQDPAKSYIEGSWMTKHNGRYYLQYSGPGTEWKCYAVGCYVSDHPMGPFVYQARNPIILHRGGLVNGCGHHSMVEGPDGTLWCFYTTLVRIEHAFERRIAMDPAGFDVDGNLFVAGPTETPQWAPGVVADPTSGNDAGHMPLSVNRFVRASSFAPGHEPVYAVDDYIRTWWEAGEESAPHWLEVDLDREWEVCAARTMFADRGLDYDAGILPGPYQYRIDGSLDGQQWTTLLDMSENTIDRHIAYDTFPTARARHIRLTILAAPAGIRPAIWEFTVFGRLPGE